MKPELLKETKWLRFMIVDRKPKTLVIEVGNKSGHSLGKIKWHGPWRQYVWESTNVDAIFNNGCLQDIADVLSYLNKLHRLRRQSV